MAIRTALIGAASAIVLAFAMPAMAAGAADHDHSSMGAGTPALLVAPPAGQPATAAEAPAGMGGMSSMSGMKGMMGKGDMGGMSSGKDGMMCAKGGMGGGMGGGGMCKGMGGGGMGGCGGMKGGSHDHAMGADLTDHTEGRIAFLKAELRITEAQAPQWTAFADALRQAAKAAADRKAARAAATTQPKPLKDMLVDRDQALSVRAQAVKALADAYAKLDAKLADDQRKTAEELVTPYINRL